MDLQGASKRLNQIYYGNDGTEQREDPDNPDAWIITRPNGDVHIYHKTTGELLNAVTTLDAEFILDDILDAEEIG